MQNLFSFFIIFLLIGCTDTVKQKQPAPSQDTAVKTVTQTDTLRETKTISGKERILTKEEHEERERTDSIRLSKVLHLALSYADRHKFKNSFKHEFETTPDDSSFQVTTQMVYGHLFDPGKKHLLVRRNVAWGAICNVFLWNNGRFRNVCQREQFSLTYLDDTLKDINGDGYKDFLVHWYPASGCCRRNVYNAFLYQPQTGSFTRDYQFINPTFFPKEKVIRGVEYGHPGEVGLYKYKWNGLRVDTIEYVYHYANHNGKFIKTKRPEYKPSEKDGFVLNSLPKEYRRIESIESIEWFLGY